MPAGKSRTKDDTWKEADLKKALQGEKKRERGDAKSKESSSDRRERRPDQEEDRRRRRETRDDIANGDHKDREHRRRDKDGDREKRREREDREKGEKSSRDKDHRREREKQKETEGETSGLGRDIGSQDCEDKERRRTRDKDKERDKDKDKDRERRHRSRRDDSGKDEGKSSDKDKERRKRRDEGESSSHKSSDSKRETSREHRDRRKERERDDSSRHRDEKREKRRERSREKDSRDRRKEHSDSKERSERPKDGRERRSDRDKRKEKDDSRDRRRDKSRDGDDKSRRRDKEKHDSEKEERSHHREKEMLATLKQEEDIKSKEQLKTGERFRADTLETADAVDEEDEDHGHSKANSTGRRESVNVEDVTQMGGADDYDDDFEDYEDDFENDQDNDDDDDEGNNSNVEDRNAGMQELLKAINLENETARALSREGSKLSRSSDDDSKRETPIRTPTTRGRINFVVAKQKQISQKVASRTRKRGQELMHLIDLDVAVFDIFDLPPMNEYDLYIKNFGRSDTKQAYVQCNDDNLEKDIQTEDIETRTMWTQNPPEDFHGCGGEDSNTDELSLEKNQANFDSVRLSRFLQSAGQVCLVLLEEAVAEHSSTMVKEKKELSCSDGYIPLTTKQPYLAGRVIESLHVSPVQSHLLLTAYGPVVDQSKVSSKINSVISTKSIICLWNVNEPSQPQKVLICESVPRCCCLSPSKATIAFAGLEDGTVVSWDLRESSPVHYTLDIDNTPVSLRPPTFSTAGVLSQDNHHSPVVELLPVVMPGDRSLLQEISRSAFSAKASSGIGNGLKADELLGLSFQLASLEEDGVINIWVVVEMEAADIAGSESDLGLAPGGRIKLIKSGSLTLDLPLRGIRKTTALQAFCMRLLPQDPNHLYVGTDSGCVLHSIRHGGRAPPKAYKPNTDCLIDVTAIDVSPWQLPCLLAGSRDGSIRLYHLHNEYPQSTWSTSTNGSAVVSIQWSHSIPSVFYVLDDNSNLYIWDLLQDESAPVSIDKIKQGRLVSFELSSDYAASGIGVPGRTAELVLGYQNGVVEVHKIASRFGKPTPDGLDRFHSYLEAAI